MNPIRYELGIEATLRFSKTTAQSRVDTRYERHLQVYDHILQERYHSDLTGFAFTRLLASAREERLRGNTVRANTEREPATKRMVRGSPWGGPLLFSIDTLILCRSYLTVFRAVRKCFRH